MCDTEDPDLNYENLINGFCSIIDKRAPLKQKTLRGNEAPFMNKNLRKAIYTRSRLKNRYNKNPTDDNKTQYKKQRNKCVNLRKKAIKTHFKNITDSGIIENKKFWQTIKPFITNKSGISNNSIMIIESDSLVTDDKKLATIFNDYYINIIEKSSGIKPNFINYGDNINKKEIVENIVKNFENHPSIIKIKETNTNTDLFHFKKIDENDIKKLFLGINTKTSTGEDKIPTKLAKLARNHLLKPLKNAINSSIRSSIFPNKAKRAAVTPLDKGGKYKTSISNYRPVSVLNVFSKFYERIMKEQITSFIDSKLSSFLSAYRKMYNTQHVLLRLIEEWKNKLQSWTLISRLFRNVAEKCFSANVPKVLIFGLLIRTGTINDFSC